MSTETTAVERVESFSEWQAGVIAGIAGAVVMAVLISVMNPPTLAVAIPALYGLSGGVAGWVVHLSHGAILGVAYAALLPRLHAGSSSRARVGTGIGWGVVTWVFLAALVMPVWLSAVGFPNAPPLPNFAFPSLLWHVLYGATLGAVYTALR